MVMSMMSVVGVVGVVGMVGVVGVVVVVPMYGLADLSAGVLTCPEKTLGATTSSRAVMHWLPETAALKCARVGALSCNTLAHTLIGKADGRSKKARKPATMWATKKAHGRKWFSLTKRRSEGDWDRTGDACSRKKGAENCNGAEKARAHGLTQRAVRSRHDTGQPRLAKCRRYYGNLLKPCLSTCCRSFRPLAFKLRLEGFFLTTGRFTL